MKKRRKGGEEEEEREEVKGGGRAVSRGVRVFEERVKGQQNAFPDLQPPV